MWNCLLLVYIRTSNVPLTVSAMLTDNFLLVTIIVVEEVSP